MSRATMNKTIRGVGASGSAVITASDGTNSATATIQCRPAGEIDIDSPLDQVTMGNSVTYTYTFLNADGTPGAAEPTISIDDPTVATISDKTYDTTTGEGSFKANGVKSATERATTLRMLGSAGGQIISADIEVIAKKPTAAYDPNSSEYFVRNTTGNTVNGTYTGAYSDISNYSLSVHKTDETDPGPITDYIDNETISFNPDGTFVVTFDTVNISHFPIGLRISYDLLGTASVVASHSVNITAS